MTRRLGDFSQEQMDLLREYYIANDISIPDLSAMAQSICGIYVQPNILHRYSKQERWDTQRTRAMYGRDGLPTSVDEEAGDIRAIVYDAIMSGDVPPRDIAALVRAWTELKGMGHISQQSGKTSLQQVFEELRHFEL